MSIFNTAYKNTFSIFLNLQVERYKTYILLNFLENPSILSTGVGQNN